MRNKHDPSAQRAAGQPLKLGGKLSDWERAEEQCSHLLTCTCAQAHAHTHANAHPPRCPQEYNQDPHLLDAERSRWGSRLAFLGEGDSFPQVPATSALLLAHCTSGRGVGNRNNQKLPPAVNRQGQGCLGASKLLGPSLLSALNQDRERAQPQPRGPRGPRRLISRTPGGQARAPLTTTHLPWGGTGGKGGGDGACLMSTPCRGQKKGLDQ